VRGIVAAKLGRQYVGHELRAEQVAANRAQAAQICAEGIAPLGSRAIAAGSTRLAPRSTPISFSAARPMRISRSIRTIRRISRRSAMRLSSRPIARSSPRPAPAKARSLRLLRRRRYPRQARRLSRFRGRYRPGVPRRWARILQRGDPDHRLRLAGDPRRKAILGQPQARQDPSERARLSQGRRYRNDPAVDKPPEQDPAIADALAALDREEAARRAGAAAAATDAIKQLDSEEAKKP
jgi:hypothetical protein